MSAVFYRRGSAGQDAAGRRDGASWARHGPANRLGYRIRWARLLMSLAGDSQGLTRAGAMTMRGPGGEAGPGGDPTLPLPARDLPDTAPRRGVPGRGLPARGDAAGTVTSGRGYAPPAYRPAVPDLRRHRARRLAGAVGALILLGAVAFGGLLIVPPSVGNARELAQAQDRAHHVASPGPAVPARFAESLVATEDKRFYSEPGIDLFAV